MAPVQSHRIRQILRTSMATMGVSLDAYTARTGRLDLLGVDFEDFRDRPLSPETLRCLRYMHDVEFHTICYLRDLLVTSAHADPDITSFLSFWTYEEYWHGEALAEVLSVHGEETGTDVRRLDRRIETLPGLGGLRLLGDAVANLEHATSPGRRPAVALSSR